MYISLDEDQAQVLREILENTLTQLRIESARTDSHRFHELLMKREQIVESLLSMFGGDSHATA